ncbi:MAG: hypothetical protein ACFFDI_22590 [Promethearchaeota archaeon]
MKEIRRQVPVQPDLQKPRSNSYLFEQKINQKLLDTVKRFYVHYIGYEFERVRQIIIGVEVKKEPVLLTVSSMA